MRKPMEAVGIKKPFGHELFSSPYKERIQRVLPTLFNMVELENRRGNKLGMEVGTARERVLIALFMYVYDSRSIEFPPSTSPELDVYVNNQPVSIKTKMSKGLSGVKLVWTVDWDKIEEFLESYVPASHLLYVNIIWGDTGRFFLIPMHVQRSVLQALTIENYVKVPPRGTNPRGVELSKTAMQYLQTHAETQSMPIQWERDKSLLGEQVLYDRWIRLWDTV